MIVAIPVLDDRGKEAKVSPHFGHNPLFAIYDTETMETRIITVGEHGSGCTPVEELEKHKIDSVYVLGIGGRAMELLREKGISIKTGAYKTVKEVLDNLDKLEELEEGCGH